MTLRANISPCYGLVLLNGEVKHGVAGKANVQSTLCLLLAGLITSPQLTLSVTYSMLRYEQKIMPRSRVNRRRKVAREIINIYIYIYRSSIIN